MAHNTRQRANLAAWATNSAVLNTEYDAIDQLLFEAINGDQGGTWAPAAQIIIGGEGLEVAGLFEATGNSILGNAGGDTITVNGTATFLSHVTIGPTLSDVSLIVLQDVEIGGGIEVDGFATIEDLIVNDTSTFTGTATFNGHVTIGNAITDILTVNANAVFYGNTQFRLPITFVPPASIIYNVATGADADTLYHPGTVQEVHVPNGGITGARDYTVDPINTFTGQRIAFINYDTSFEITIYANSPPVLVAVIGGPPVNDNPTWCELTKHGTDFVRSKVGRFN